jgi:hypothetical protein
MVWHHTLESNPGSDKSDPIDAGHLGPTLAYMAKVGSALQQNVTGLKCKRLIATYERRLTINRVQGSRRRHGFPWTMGSE